ncbi:MAG: hypothetical protein NTW87_05495 [Planctomycetota bacterium]|nr:hypothetical protein [Planctomycetota bacterium]
MRMGRGATALPWVKWQDEAVRQPLDRAVSKLGEATQRGETGLKAPERTGRLGIA